MSKIVEKIIEVRKKLPSRFNYASKVRESLSKKGVEVPLGKIYKIGAGLKNESDFTETDLLIAKEIVALANEHEAKKEAFLSDIESDSVSSRKGKKSYTVRSEELITV